MTAPGPPGPGPGHPPHPRPPQPPRPRVLAAVAAGLVLGTALILTPLAIRVWTTAMVPAANRIHYGATLLTALALAALTLYALTSALFTPRRTYSPADSAPVLRGAGTRRPGVSVLVEPSRSRSEDTAAGVSASPGPTSAATTTTHHKAA